MTPLFWGDVNPYGNLPSRHDRPLARRSANVGNRIVSNRSCRQTCFATGPSATRSSGVSAPMSLKRVSGPHQIANAVINDNNIT
jgi:hypothetical protein